MADRPHSGKRPVGRPRKYPLGVDAHGPDGRAIPSEKLGSDGATGAGNGTTNARDDVVANGQGIGTDRAVPRVRQSSAGGGWLGAVKTRLTRTKGMIGNHLPRQLALAVLSKAESMTPLEVVDAIAKCQAMAIRATLLPKKSGEAREDLKSLRKAYFEEFGLIEKEELPNGEDQGSLPTLTTHPGGHV